MEEFRPGDKCVVISNPPSWGGFPVGTRVKVRVKAGGTDCYIVESLEHPYPYSLTRLHHHCHLALCPSNPFSEENFL